MLKSRIIYVHIITAFIFLGTLTSLAYGLKLNEKDYTITGFGIKDGNPFITVQVLQVGLMILQWVMKGMKHMFLIRTKEFSR